MYVEPGAPGSEEAAAFVGTAGLRKVLSLGAGEGRGLYAATYFGGQNLYAAVGSTLYQITLTGSTWSSSVVGTLNSNTGRVCMASNLSQLVVSQPGFVNWQVAPLGGGAMTSVSSTPNTQLASMIAYMDGFGVYSANTGITQQFFITGIDDFTSINALNTAQVSSLPDPLMAIVSTQREVWMIGSITTEIWSDTGAATFPFERIPGGILPYGTGSPFAAVYLDGSVFFPTLDAAGTLRVARSVGYQMEFISTIALEHAFQTYEDVQDSGVGIWAYGYSQDGHTFYVINFPAADITWAYDTVTKTWAQRGYRDSDGILHADIIAGSVHYSGFQVCLDPTNGNIYVMDNSTYTHNGNPIYRERAWPILGPKEVNRIRIDRLELDAETGTGNTSGTDTDPQVWLDMSFDGGRTFGVSRYQSMGKVGVYNNVPVWMRCGMGRRPVARLATTAETKVTWMGVNINGEVLNR
jgi:hypothetical protein